MRAVSITVKSPEEMAALFPYAPRGYREYAQDCTCAVMWISSSVVTKLPEVRCAGRIRFMGISADNLCYEGLAKRYPNMIPAGGDD